MSNNAQQKTSEKWTGLPPECEPNYDLIVTEDDTLVDGLYSERQHRLLTNTLCDSWQGPGEGRPFLAATDVGVFYSTEEPPLVPDVFVSLDVVPNSDMKQKKHRSYFIWVFGKPPEMAMEVVSNCEGGELSSKLTDYARIGIAYYVVWDPFCYLGKTTLHCFLLQGKKYLACDPWFPELELGVTIWDGVIGGIQGPWLRWCDAQGNLLPTGRELAKTEEQRADSAEQRAAKLAEKLRALGIDPDQ